MADDYQFDDLDTTPGESTSSEEVSVDGDAGTGATADPVTTPDTGSTVASSTSSSTGSNGGGNGYATELFSKQIKAKFRTFFVDLKESSNGKFIKISEKSHGRKSTIMMDAEDIPVFIEALQEVSEHL